MLTRSTWLHLRIPFSYFLLPVYLFALGISPNLEPDRMLWVFLIVHLLLYPASNGYNSYFDKDEKSIGGLRNPPPVNTGLYYTSLLLDVVAIVAGYIKVNLLFALMLLIYGLASKAYSHPSIRLKKYPIGGWLITGIMQGFFTFLMCYVGINDFEVGNLLHIKVIFPALLTSLMLMGNYPMTQVYQHEQDRLHGDLTLSSRLGVRGTFLFVLIMFLITAGGFSAYFALYQSSKFVMDFMFFLFPVAAFFLYWMARVWQDSARVNYGNTMLLNFISATCLGAFFIYFFFTVSHVGQYL